MEKMQDSLSYRGIKTTLIIFTSLFVASLLFLPLSFSRSGIQLSFFDVLTPSSSSPLPSEDIRCKEAWRPATLSSTTSKYAYVTLLAVDQTQNATEDLNDDLYFVGMRMQAYQILHAPATRSHNIPYIVLAAPGASERKKTRLRRDGAIVVDIDSVQLPEWFPATLVPKWQDMFDKLRLWELTQFERVVLLDADTVLTGPLDELFDSVPLQQVRREQLSEDETAIQLPPDEYVLTAGAEVLYDHHFPPSAEAGDYARHDYFNAGFFVAKPSLQMLDYYLSMLQIPNSFPTALMEQDFLNYVHRQDGAMPFAHLDPIWNIHFPTKQDFDAGVRSLHTKWWIPRNEELLPYLISWRYKMEGFFESWDARTHASFGTNQVPSRL